MDANLKLDAVGYSGRWWTLTQVIILGHQWTLMDANGQCWTLNWDASDTSDANGCQFRTLVDANGRHFRTLLQDANGH